jgi:hypothetical protein
MKKLLFAVAFTFAAQLSIAQTADSAVKKDAVRLLELSGANAQYEVAINQIVKNVPAEKQAEFRKEIVASMKGLTEKVADIYVAEFTHDDIKNMIKYYESPVGKKAASKTGVIAEKAQEIGMEWAQTLQPIVMKYMPQ